MFRCISAAVLSCAFLAAAPSVRAGELFGPARYDVNERHGKDNRYQQTINVPAGQYLIRIQAGEALTGRPDVIEVRMNGAALIASEQFGYPFFACFVELKDANVLEVNLRDRKPLGMRRPHLPPKFITMSVRRPVARFPAGVYGLQAWEDLSELIRAVRGVRSPDARVLAFAAVDLSNERPARVAAMAALARRRDAGSRMFLVYVHADSWADPGVRAEALFGLGMLGNAVDIPLIMNGLVHPDERIRAGSVRALALFPESETAKPLIDLLQRLDTLRKHAVLSSIAESGWMPVATLQDMAASTDAVVANRAVEALGHIDTPHAFDILSNILAHPGAASRGVVITALGKSRDPRAADRLLAEARDPVLRRGVEAELALALAELGDARAADVIREMASAAETRGVVSALYESYWRLTGRRLEPLPAHR